MTERTERDLRHRAAEARRLANEPLLVEAIEKIRLEALVALGEVKADDANEIHRLQAKAAIGLDIIVELQAIIVQGGDEGGGSGEDRPTGE